MSLPDALYESLIEELELSCRGDRRDAEYFYSKGVLCGPDGDGRWVWQFQDSGETWTWDPSTERWTMELLFDEEMRRRRKEMS